MHAGTKNEVEKKTSICWRLIDLAPGKESLLNPHVTREAIGTKQMAQSKFG